MSRQQRTCAMPCCCCCPSWLQLAAVLLVPQLSGRLPDGVLSMPPLPMAALFAGAERL